MKRGKYAAIGYVVSKFVVPVVKRQMRKKARASTANAARATTGAVKGHPVRSSLALGSLVGAVTWLIKRRGDHHSGSEPRRESPAPRKVGGRRR